MVDFVSTYMENDYSFFCIHDDVLIDDLNELQSQQCSAKVTWYFNAFMRMLMTRLTIMRY